MGTLCEDQYIFFIISHSFLLRMRNISDKRCRENQNTHFEFDNYFFKKLVLCDIIWKNIVEPCRPQMTVWCMCLACWIPNATNTCLEYVILITFVLQQWLRKHVSLLCYTYIVCLVYYLRHLTYNGMKCYCLPGRDILQQVSEM